MAQIDFNCDLGEGCGNDPAIVPLISSASIACGGHAGDAATMRQAVALCLQHDVAIGAHPSFEDRANFGRREMSLTPADVYTLVTGQVEALVSVCGGLGAQLRHVKPHGALYNLAARERPIADAIASATLACHPSLVLYALSGSCLADAGRAMGLQVADEAFAERRYDSNGRLAARGTADAVIEDLDTALAQVRMLLREGCVVARDGTRVRLRADTLCLHGDRPDAVVFAQALRTALEDEGVIVTAPERPG